MELVDPKIIDKRKRKQYTYKCSGAIYDGEWIGGMRHGVGTMTWKDGA